MERKIKLPDGQEVIYDDVPVTVMDSAIRARAAADPEFQKHFRGVNVKAWIAGQAPSGQLEDVGRSALGGLSRGTIEGANALWRKAPSGLAMMALDAAGAEGPLKSLIGVSKKADELQTRAVEATGGSYKPQTTAGRYTYAGTQGVGGALSSGTVNPWALALGGVTGTALQGAEDANLGPFAQTAIALGLPISATLLRRTLFPKLGYDEVQAAMGVPKREWYKVGKSKELRAAEQALKDARRVAAEADDQGLTLLPAQAIQQPNAPQSGIINLQNRVTPSTAGATTLKPVLDMQAAQANEIVDTVIATAKESGRYANDLAAARSFYEMLRNQPLTPASVSNIVRQLKGSPLYQTKGTDQHKFLSKIIDMLEQQGTATTPGGQQVTQTIVQSGRSQVPLLGVQNIPPQQVPLPARTQGQLLDIRAQAAKGFPDVQGIPQAQRAEARTALNLGRSPEIEGLDTAYGPAMDKQNFVQRLEEGAATARGGSPEMVGSNFAAGVRGAPGSTTQQEWMKALNPVQFEQPDTASKIASLLTMLERTGYGRGGTRRIEPNEFGQARSSAPVAITAAAGLRPRSSPLALLPPIREKMLELETQKLAEALADTSGRKLAKLLTYDPNKELIRNMLTSMGIGYGLETTPTGEP